MTALSPSPTRQRFEALDRANDIRTRRAQLKEELHDGTRRIEDVLREPEWHIFTLQIFELLTWAPKIGKVKRNTVLRRADVWPLKEVGKLTMRQRLRLLAEIQPGGDDE